MLRSLIVFFIVALFSVGCFNLNVKEHNEHYYQIQLCNNLNGKMEYVLKDKTRIDCLTDKYAIEVDFAKKWAESIGQSLYYAKMTDKKPAVALIVGEKDNRFIQRLEKVTQELNIKVFIIKKEN